MKPTAYNDGMAFFYREKDRKTDFNAKRNVSALDDMEFIVKLAFDECSKRVQDMEFAEQSGFSLSLKIRTRYVPMIQAKHKAVINDYLYEVSYIDKSDRELYVYLEGVKPL